MLSYTPHDMSDTRPSNTVQKLNAAMQQLREHHEEEWMFEEPNEIDLSPTGALGIRAHAIKKFYSSLSDEMLTKYLKGLGYVREQLMFARDVLNANGKKKYETYIINAVETLPARFYDLKPYYLGILTNLMSIPFRRSTEKDRREISNSLCLIADLIKGYRYKGTNEQYREYAQTIARGVDTEQLPPMIAGLIIQELTALVDAACVTNVMSFASSGITHEEYWRHTDPDEYIDVYPGGEIPEDASPTEDLEIYSPHYGIAQQSMWYGHDIYMDDFIVSLAGGLLYTKVP